MSLHGNRAFKRRKKIYLAGQDWDFVWDERDVLEAEKMYKEGLSLWDMARAFSRHPIEMAILIMDRAEKGHIEPRKRGAFGRRKKL